MDTSMARVMADAWSHASGVSGLLVDWPVAENGEHGAEIMADLLAGLIEDSRIFLADVMDDYTDGDYGIGGAIPGDGIIRFPDGSSVRIHSLPDGSPSGIFAVGDEPYSGRALEVAAGWRGIYSEMIP